MSHWLAGGAYFAPGGNDIQNAAGDGCTADEARDFPRCARMAFDPSGVKCLQKNKRHTFIHRLAVSAGRSGV